jgi:hypothetical protein
VSAGRICSVLVELSPALPRNHLLRCELGPNSTQIRGGCRGIVGLEGGGTTGSPPWVGDCFFSVLTALSRGWGLA